MIYPRSSIGLDGVGRSSQHVIDTFMKWSGNVLSVTPDMPGEHASSPLCMCGQASMPQTQNDWRLGEGSFITIA